MKDQILKLQRRLKQHVENYQDLKSEELYLAYKYDKYKLSRDQLDYLMCQAICCMPLYADCMPLDLEWNLLHTINKAINVEGDLDPQLAIIAQVIAKREILDINQNWLSSVIKLYELIMHKNLTCIATDLTRVKQLKTPVVAKKPLVVSFDNSVTASIAEDDEECCNWVTRDFTAMIF